MYDKSFKNEFGPKASKVEAKINAVMVHAQAWLHHGTLYSKFTFNIEDYVYVKNKVITASGSKIE